MIKRNCLFILVTLLSFFITGNSLRNIEYSQQELNVMAEEIADKYSFPFAKDGGISCGLYDINGNIETTYLFDIKGDNLKKMIYIGSMFDVEREYMIIFFDNYKQRDFGVNGQLVSKYAFKAKKYGHILLPIEIVDLQKGFHDVFFVIVKYPSNKSLDNDFRRRTDMGNLTFIRFNILVDNNTVPTINLDKFDNHKKTIFDGVFLSKEQDELLLWLTEDVYDFNKVNFNIHIGNMTLSQQQNFAVLTLLDWNQIEFYNNKNVAFCSVKKGEEISIPSSIEVPDKKGVYDLVSILVYNPYEPLTIYNHDVETGIRVGINVK